MVDEAKEKTMIDYVATATISGEPAFETVETIGQQWLLLPDHLEWGLEKYLIVRAGPLRLILCRVERFMQSAGSTPVAGGIRQVPIKADELPLCEF